MDGLRDISAWTSAITGDKDNALVAASTRLDEEKYLGVLADSITPQRMKWPRTGAIDENELAIANDIIPDQIQRAAMELALRMLRAGDVDLFGPTGLEGFENVEVGSIDVLVEASETPESKQFNQILEKQGARAAIAWREARLAKEVEPPA